MPDAPPLKLTIDASGAKRGAAQYSSATDRIKRESKDTASNIDGLGRRLTTFGASLNSTAARLTGLFGGISAGLVSARAISAFSDFERALVGVGKTADLEGAELEAFGQQILNLAQTIPETSQGLLNIAQAAGQLGVQGTDNLLLFSKTIAQLGSASDLSGEQAATALVRILNITNDGIENVDRLASAIVGLGNNFAANESEIADVAQRLAQETAAFRTSAEDLVGLATALRSFGVQSERAGGVVGRTFVAIQEALSAGGDELRAFTDLLGISAQELRDNFRADSFDVFTRLVGQLNAVTTAGGDTVSVLSSLGLEAGADIAVLSTLAQNFGAVERALRRSSDEYERNTALSIEAAKAAQTFSAQMQLVRNAVDAAAVELGRELVPVVLEAAQAFRDFIVEARKTGELQETFAQVGDALVFLRDNAEAVTAAFSALIGLRIGAAFGPIGAAIGAAAGAMAALAASSERVRGLLGGISAQSADVLEERLASNRDQIERLESRQVGNSTRGQAAIDRLREENFRIEQQLIELEDLQPPVEEGLVVRATTPRGFDAFRPNFFNRLEGGTGGGGGGRSGGGSSAADQAEQDADALEKRLLSVLKATDAIQAQRDAYQASIDNVRSSEESLAQSIEASVLTAYERYQQQVAEVTRLQDRNIISSETADRKLKQLKTEYQEAAFEASFLGDAFTQLGFTMTSAFEEAIFSASTFQEVLQALAQDLGRLFFRQFATQAIINPLAGFLGAQVAGPRAGAAGPTFFQGGTQGFASGGLFRGSGTSTSDSNLVRLSDREYVVNAAATRKHLPLLEAINGSGRPSGGLVPGYASGGPVMARGDGLTLVNNITVNRSPGVAPAASGDEEQDRKLANQISNLVERSTRQLIIEELVNQKRPGGVLNTGRIING